MRKIYLTALILIALINFNLAQSNVTFSFTAEMDSAHKQLDSILIKNLTKGCDTILYGLDTVLTLGPTGIFPQNNLSHKQSFIVSTYPNPFYEKTNFEILLQKNETVKIQVYNLLGRELLSFEKTLEKGLHSFCLYPDKEKVYIVAVSANNNFDFFKLINLGFGNNDLTLKHIETKAVNLVLKREKSSFQWETGDDLFITGYSTTDVSIIGSDIILDNPAGSTDYIFHILHGLPCDEAPYVIDYDGNVYKTVEIGSQCWMKENLKVTHYADGTPINYITADSVWANQSGEDKAYTYYNNNTNNEAEIFGALYTWAAAMNGSASSNNMPSGVQGICPDGWHIPSDDEWFLLENYLIASGYNYDFSTDSNRIAKSLAASTLWTSSPNEGVVGNDLTSNNRSGFTALPSAHRDGSGAFPNFGNHGKFWSATEYNVNTSYNRNISFNYIDLYRNNYNKRNGYSVRCVNN